MAMAYLLWSYKSPSLTRITQHALCNTCYLFKPNHLGPYAQYTCTENTQSPLSLNAICVDHEVNYGMHFLKLNIFTKFTR